MQAERDRLATVVFIVCKVYSKSDEPILGWLLVGRLLIMVFRAKMIPRDKANLFPTIGMSHFDAYNWHVSCPAHLDEVFFNATSTCTEHVHHVMLHQVPDVLSDTSRYQI